MATEMDEDVTKGILDFVILANNKCKVIWFC